MNGKNYKVSLFVIVLLGTRAIAGDDPQRDTKYGDTGNSTKPEEHPLRPIVVQKIQDYLDLAQAIDKGYACWIVNSYREAYPTLPPGR